jgi:hypothetical protein
MSRLPFEDGDYVVLKGLNLFGSLDPQGILLFKNVSPDPSGSFQMVHKGGKTWAFYSTAVKKYLTVTDDGQVICNAPIPLGRETFLLIGSDPRHVLFKNQANDCYCRQVIGGEFSLFCVDREVPEKECFFEIERQ